MDLPFNGQYRMLQLSKFRLLDKDSADVLIIPSLVEKFKQIKVATNTTSFCILKFSIGNHRKNDEQPVCKYGEEE